jgi:hypothetical protein
MYAYQSDLLFQTEEEASFGTDRMLGKAAGDEMRAKVAVAYEEHSGLCWKKGQLRKWRWSWPSARDIID